MVKTSHLGPWIESLGVKLIYQIPKEPDHLKLQRLEKRVKELENVLNRPNLHPTSDHVSKFYQHPIDVTFLNYKDRKRILITGGSGFVGSHLTDKLMLAGHEVIVADNMFTGKY